MGNGHNLPFVQYDEIDRDKYIVAIFLNYWLWLATAHPEITIRPEQVAILYQRWVRGGEDPWTVCDELGLPEDPEW